ncbi:MAG: hypothetical protein QGH73_04285 [Rhodospirillales bacterium]|nr:hypothetical protein [Rhodospirillales bacterium]
MPASIGGANRVLSLVVSLAPLPSMAARVTSTATESPSLNRRWMGSGFCDAGSKICASEAPRKPG